MRLPKSFQDTQILEVLVVLLEVDVVGVTEHDVNENCRLYYLGFESAQAIVLFFFGKYAFDLVRLVSPF